jgi:hypothetical protein
MAEADDAPRTTAGTIGAVVLGLLLLLLAYGFVTRLGSGDPEPPPPALSGQEAPADIVQVGVRNGTDVDGLARRTRDVLRSQGFDVLEADNYDTNDVDSTFVIDRVGDPASAQRVADALGLPPGRVREEIRPDLYLDATVVLGADYATLPALANEPPGD